MARPSHPLAYELTEWAQIVLPALDAMADGRAAPQVGREMAALIDAFAKRWVDEHTNASKEAANKQAAALMWSLIAVEARQRIAQIARSCDPADPQQAEAALEPWLGVIEALGDAERVLASNVNLGLVCDHVVSRIQRALGRRGVAVG